MRIATLALFALLFASTAWAHDVDGKWSGNLETPMGPVTITFTFKADGTSLSGTTTGPDGSTIAFKDGKVDGNKIEFVINVDFGGMAMQLPYTGVVSPAKIDLKADFMGMPLEFSVTKAKE
jgi:hypothetical protein